MSENVTLKHKDGYVPPLVPPPGDAAGVSVACLTFRPM